MGLSALAAPVLVAALAAGAEGDPYAARRERMSRDIGAAYGVTDARVLEALRRVPRHRFVPRAARAVAYEDTPLPIGEGQTISAPGIVAAMTAAAAVGPKDSVLEVGTGSGYQAAVLSLLAREVWSIEILPTLAARARATLAELGYGNVTVRAGDGFAGWPERAPFDAVVVTCAPEAVPRALVDQLKEGGRLVIPVGPDGPDAAQTLWLYRKTGRGLVGKELLPVRFVPMTGAARDGRR